MPTCAYNGIRTDGTHGTHGRPSKRFDCQAGEYAERARRRQVEHDAKVIKFLAANPLSTAKEVFAATGCGVIGVKYVTHAHYKGRTVWRLNHKKLKADGIR